MANWSTALFSLLLLSNVTLAKSIFADAPCWVTNTSCVAAEYVAVGIGKTSYSNNAQLATLQAQNNALANLALLTNSTVNFTSSNQKAINYTGVEKHWLETSQELASITSNVALKGVKCIDKWVDRNDTLYILVVVEQSRDITNINITESKADYTSSSPLELYKSVIKSNMDYASQLTNSIRTEVSGFTR